MSEDSVDAEGGASKSGKSGLKISGASFADLASNIIDSCIYNIIHDTTLAEQRAEKTLRAQSAATRATETALAQLANSSSDAPSASGKNALSNLPSGRVEADGAVYDGGRVCLRGNPLVTVPEITCPRCKLPRLHYPITGVGARQPDVTKQYCTRHPFVSRPGYDIYGNPFPTDMAKTKKERELLRQQQRADKDGTPNSQDTGTPPDKENMGSKNNSLSTGGKPASYIPWHTCPNCKRSLLITRFAQHLEKCLGISGRQSSRNAMAKLNGSISGTGTGNGATPLGSRVGTPVPSGLTAKDKKGAADDEAAGEEKDTPKKVKKKSSYIKKADREKMEKEGKPTPKPLGRPPKKSQPQASEGNEKGKRDRDEGEAEVPRKKLKISREGSGAKKADDDNASIRSGS
ncbi:hypothetical protein BDY21DRAFT_387441 [Lineolata rhizophorae]|uniref:SAGA-associated factor 11 n=1 Tax=Lineolata rhizophorae TaxID=578093 RepID=A0A6A6NT15_9PEZI|nr:hypothetical protein BDY21DRAFT_387441 [Lineolata rhizophorae]